MDAKSKADFINSVASGTSVPFEQVNEQEAPVKIIKYDEPDAAFAKGLPEWSIEPPQIMVRRH